MSVDLNDSERLLILKALRDLSATDATLVAQISNLAAKIIDTPHHPSISVGVYGGQVQWVLGNPFPIRICDYDGDGEDLPDFDERGQQCRMWFEPADKSNVQP
jgi:hypothetical protein